MPTWKEALSSRNTKRNTFLGIAGMFIFLTILTGNKAHFLFVPAALALSYLFSSKLEWGWEIPSRAKRGETFVVKLYIKNKALSYSIFKGDVIHDISFVIEPDTSLSIVDKGRKFFSSLEAGEKRTIEFRLKTSPTTAPDLYGLVIKSSCSAGRSERYFEVYIYDE